MNRIFATALFASMTLSGFAHDHSRGKATQTFGDKAVVIEYGRPEFKDRDLNQIPAGTIWGIGADAATTLNTAAVLKFDDQQVPAGTYRLLAEKMPAGHWELIISADPQAGRRGRDTSLDVARIPLTTAQLKEPVKMLTISLASRDDGAQLSIAWGSNEISTTFSAD